MNLTLNFPLAETSFADINVGYQEEVVSGGLPIWIYAVIAMVIVAITVAVIAWRNQTPTILNTPLGMLHELCKAHRVNRQGRRLLEQMSEAASLANPATLFTGPEHLDACVKQTQNSIDYRSKHASTLSILRRKLYG